MATYLNEALHTWNALTSMWRAEFSFPLTTQTWWYDLTQVPNTLRPLTFTTTALINEMEYMLLEPASVPPSWTGSAQFQLSDLTGAIQRRRDETLNNTGCQISRSLVAATAGRTYLPDNLIDLRRVAYIPAAPGTPITLASTDIRAKYAYNPLWTVSTQTIGTYMQSTQPPLSFDVDYPPAPGGQYEVLTVNAGSAVTGVPVELLGIPDDWAWVVKYGALADLLNRESNSKDAQRAAYCNVRYQMGLKLLQFAPALLGARINNVPVSYGPLRSGDDYSPTWQALPPGPPDRVYVAGLNLLGTSQVDAFGTYTALVEVVQNAPVTVNPTDNVQVSRQDYDAVLDLAQHLAAFKMGGAEFQATLPLWERFLTQAAVYNKKLLELGQYTRALYETSSDQERRDPREEVEQDA